MAGDMRRCKRGDGEGDAMTAFDIQSETLLWQSRTNLKTDHYGGLTITLGIVHTTFGTVEVDARHNANGGWNTSMFCMAYQGRLYRGYAPYHQPRYLVTLAARFAAQVIQEATP